MARLDFKASAKGRGNIRMFGGGKVTGSVSVSGLADIEKKLLAIGRVPASDAGRDALWLATRPLAAAIASQAPVNPNGPTPKSWRVGAGLGKSSGPQFYGSLRENIRRGVVINPPSGSQMAQVGTGDAFWGLFLERGTVNRYTQFRGDFVLKASAPGKRKRWSREYSNLANRGRVAATNWMARAFQAASQLALSQLSMQLEQAIAKAAKRDAQGLSGRAGIWAKVWRP